VDTKDLFARYVVPSYGRFDLKLARGEGCYVWDEAGRKYLDFGAGIAVCSVGHSHPRIAAMLERQARTLVHTSNLYYTRPQGVLAKRLVECVGAAGKIFFCNSGAEANEALYKLARKFGNECPPPAPRHSAGELLENTGGRHGIICFSNSFHGRTLAGISATGQEKVKRGFEPMVDGFVHVPFLDAPAVVAAITPETAAVLVEPVQGESGINPASTKFLQTLRAVCDDHGLLLMFDEVQCGLGRTGDWCGWKTIAPDVMPDAVSWAKGIAGGFPLGAIWVRERPVELRSGGRSSLADLLGPGSHGTTFGGTPLGCAVASEVLDIIEQENLLENARSLGAYTKSAIEKIGSPLIKEVRGLGLMIGIEVCEDFSGRVGDEKRAPSNILVTALHEAGLLSVPSATHSIRWLPPLNVTKAQIDEAVDILRSVFQKLA
jgi:predicted acetylornithine/succinylornithine family transaminase